MIQIVFKLEEVSSRPPHCRDGVVAVPSKPAEGSPKNNPTHWIVVETSRSGGAGMHRSEAEGRFGEAEPVGRSSVCARALTLGVSFCQEKNVHFTYENASHPLFIGERCTLTVKKWVNSSG